MKSPLELESNAKDRQRRYGANAARYPLAASSTNTKMPQRAPSTRYAFVAPMFRLPTVRRSTPRQRRIHSPEGSPPRRNPIRIDVRRSGIGASALRPLLAPLPVEHDRNSLEAEPLPQTTLQVTYIILDPISRIVHIQSERRRFGRGLSHVVELEVLPRRGRGGPDPVQDLLNRLVQLRRRDQARVLAVDALAHGQDLAHARAALGRNVKPRRVFQEGVHAAELFLDRGAGGRGVRDQVPLVEHDEDRLRSLLRQRGQARL